MSVASLENAAVAAAVKVPLWTIDPRDVSSSGILSIANGHTTAPIVPDMTYTFSTDPDNHLRLTGQAGTPSPAVPVLDIAPNGNITASGYMGSAQEGGRSVLMSPFDLQFINVSGTAGRLTTYPDILFLEGTNIIMSPIGSGAASISFQPATGTAKFSNLVVSGNLTAPYPTTFKSVPAAGSGVAANELAFNIVTSNAGGTLSLPNGQAVGAWVGVHNQSASSNLNVSWLSSSGAQQITLSDTKPHVFMLSGDGGANYNWFQMY